jgi:ABC-type proline/glycine betaine transport system ATPase subunit
MLSNALNKLLKFCNEWGRIIILDKPISNFFKKISENIGFAAQNADLFPQENINSVT